MDFVTHSLIGAGIARLATKERAWLPQASLAGLLGSLLVDGDSWLYLIGPEMYGRYHRTITHCLVGLVVHGLASAGLAWAAAGPKSWRRFGWFVSETLPTGEPPARAPFGLLLAVAMMAVFAHFCADIITGFGNMKLLWPWSDWDASLYLVNSFDVVLFSSTLLWHIAMRWKQRARRAEALLTAAWLAVCVSYLALRWWLIASGAVPHPVW